MSESSNRSERAAQAMRDEQRRERSRLLAAVGGVLVVLLLIAGGTWWALSSGDNADETANDSGGSSSAPSDLPDTPDNVDGYAIPIGDPKADKTVTIFEDPQCPVCAAFEASSAEPLAAAVEDGTVLAEYRIVSFLDRASTNEYSSRAANALVAVLHTAGPDAFMKMHDELFANQPAEGGDGPEDSDLIDLAVEAGAEESEVAPLIEHKAFAGWIADATEQMGKDGVTGTPTVFIDGKMIEGGPQAGLDALLEATGTN